MKKKYMTPRMECFKLENGVTLVSASEAVTGNGGGVDAGYGGVDTGGTKDPNARERMMEEMAGESEDLW